MNEFEIEPKLALRCGIGSFEYEDTKKRYRNVAVTILYDYLKSYNIDPPRVFHAWIEIGRRLGLIVEKQMKKQPDKMKTGGIIESGHNGPEDFILKNQQTGQAVGIAEFEYECLEDFIGHNWQDFIDYMRNKGKLNEAGCIAFAKKLHLFAGNKPILRWLEGKPVYTGDTVFGYSGNKYIVESKFSDDTLYVKTEDGMSVAVHLGCLTWQPKDKQTIEKSKNINIRRNIDMPVSQIDEITAKQAKAQIQCMKDSMQTLLLDIKKPTFTPGTMFVETQTEFSIAWAKENPALFDLHFNKFFDDYDKTHTITSKARKGFIVLNARLKSS